VIKRILSGLALAVVTAVAVANASEPRNFNIPPGELSSALESLAKETGLELIFQPSDLKGLQTQGVVGTLSPEQAVAQLINGTRLTIRTDAAGAMLIVAPRASTATATPTALRLSPLEGAQVAPIGGPGVQADERKPFWQRLRLAQNGEDAAGESSHGSGSSADEPEVSGSASLQEIVVTAQKREQRVFEVPMAVSLISDADLDQRGISAISELQFAVPGMTMREDGPGSNTIFLRGVVNQYGSGAVVSQYLDEVPVTLTGFNQLDVRALDFERIEVLKGPQGTLYGQGSVAGAVRYITKKPVLDAFQSEFSAETAMVDEGDALAGITAILNAPLVEDKFALRFAGRFQDGGGWQDQPAAGIEDGNGQELVDARVKALWRVSESLDVEAMYVHHRNEIELGLGFENPDRTIFVGGDPATVLVPRVSEYSIANLTITADVGGMVLTSATSYVDNDLQTPFVSQCGPDTKFDPCEGNSARQTASTLFSQELRLSSGGDGDLQWTVGAYYQDMSDRFMDDFRNFDSTSQTPYVPTFIGRYSNRDASESVSVFADVSYQLTERLLVGVGGRYFEDDRSQGVACCAADTVPIEQEGSFDSFNPRAYARFGIKEGVNLYASIATGYRSGGFNAFGDPPYDPEDVLTYELGVKGFTPNAAISYEVAAFYNDYSDMLRRGILFNGTTLTNQLSNIGDVDIYGLEGGVNLRLSEGFTLAASAAWLDTEVTDIRADDATNDPGDQLDYVPELSYTASGIFDFEWAADRPGFARLDYNYRDAVSYTDRSAFDVVPQFSESIGMLHGRIGMRLKDNHLFELYGVNLTNVNKWQDPYHQWRNANRTPPRMIGIKYTFSH
jgi:iron complex outermembrane receptor protein